MKNKLNLSISKHEFFESFKQNVCVDSLGAYYKKLDENCFMGKLSDVNFSFFYKPAFVRNSFSTVLKGTITEENGTCFIKYCFSKFKSTLIFSAVVIVFLVLISTLLFCSPPYFFGLIPLILCILYFFLSNYKSKKAKERLLKMLEIIMESKPENADKSLS